MRCLRCLLVDRKPFAQHERTRKMEILLCARSTILFRTANPTSTCRMGIRVDSDDVLVARMAVALSTECQIAVRSKLDPSTKSHCNFRIDRIDSGRHNLLFVRTSNCDDFLWSHGAMVFDSCCRGGDRAVLWLDKDSSSQNNFFATTFDLLGGTHGNCCRNERMSRGNSNSNTWSIAIR